MNFEHEVQKRVAQDAAQAKQAVADKQEWIRKQQLVIGGYVASPEVWTTNVSEVNDIQYGGNHYKTKAIQPWDYISSNGMGFLEGSIIKYVSRYQDKNGIEDLKKARHFLDKLIEVQSEVRS